MRIRDVLCSMAMVGLLLAVAAPASAKVISARRTFGHPLRAAMTTTVKKRDTTLVNRIYLQPATYGRTLMTVVSSVKGQPSAGSSTYHVIQPSASVERITRGELQAVEVPSRESTVMGLIRRWGPLTKVQLLPLKNGGAMMTVVGAKGGITYSYVGTQGTVKQLTSSAQVQKVVDWLK